MAKAACARQGHLGRASPAMFARGFYTVGELHTRATLRDAVGLVLCRNACPLPLVRDRRGVRGRRGRTGPVRLDRVRFAAHREPTRISPPGWPKRFNDPRA